jgi:hypothetical protein
MLDDFVFEPDHRAGVLFHLGAVLVFIALGLLGLWGLSRASLGPTFLVFLIPVLLSAVGVPMLAYRAYTLRTAYYVMNRDGVQLRWGFRYEYIPIGEVIWVNLARDITSNIPLPRLNWPGSISGLRRLPDDSVIEFMAADAKKLVLIATSERIFAISPSDPAAFIKAFQRLTELGSLAQQVGQSIYPTILLSQVWSSKSARILILLGLILGVALIAWIGVLIPQKPQIHLGFRVSGAPGDVVPSVRLFLLPVINSTFYTIDLLLGFFFYRNSDTRPFSYLLWGSSVFVALLFILSVFFMEYF